MANGISLTGRAGPQGRGAMLTALIMLPPALAIFTLFVALPIGEAAWYSVFNWDGYRQPQRDFSA